MGLGERSQAQKVHSARVYLRECQGQEKLVDGERFQDLSPLGRDELNRNGNEGDPRGGGGWAMPYILIWAWTYVKSRPTVRQRSAAPIHTPWPMC